MKLNIYTIFDTASGLYMRPFYQQSDGAAMRSFKDIATDPEHEVGRHPEDYSLFRIGVYDDNNAEITVEDRDCITTALELVAQARQQQPDLLREANA